MDKRHQKRMKTVQDLYSLFYSNKRLNTNDETIANIETHSQKIDAYIDEFAKEHGSDVLAKVDLAILRLAVYELLIDGKTPPKVVINEAVELAKDFGGDNSPSFINAILGGLYKKYKNHND